MSKVQFMISMVGEGRGLEELSLQTEEEKEKKARYRYCHNSLHFSFSRTRSLDGWRRENEAKGYLPNKRDDSKVCNFLRLLKDPH